MNPKFKFALILTFFALFCFTSCQDEIIEETPTNQEETIVPNSTLANLMQYTSSNNGTVDDIMDNTDCFSINLPVTIIANGITITIDSLEDLAVLEDIFQEFDNDDDILEYLFPITIILNDYEEVVINNEEELENFIAECVGEEDDAIECVDFHYPISFSIYNSSFQIIETVFIENDRELYEFLHRLENDTSSGVILASLNFPVTMVYANGETVEVHNNQELERVINEAEDNCEDDYDCRIEPVNENLMDCHWVIESFNSSDDFREFDVYFNENGELEILNEYFTIPVTGNWSTTETDYGIVLTISELTEFGEELGGDWLIVECEERRFKLIKENTGAENSYIVMEKECEDDLGCTAQEVSRYLKECLWYSGSNLIGTDHNGPYNFKENGHLIVGHPWSNDQITGTWEVVLTDEGIKLLINLPSPYDAISEIRWKVVECGESQMHLINGDNYLVLERSCENYNPFECFENREVGICDDGDVFDGIATFNLEEIYANCPQDNVEVTFHATEGDAHNNTNPLPAMYTNVENEQIIYVRVTLAGTSDYALFAVALYVEDCTNTVCSELEVDAFLMECHWIPVTIGDSNDFLAYDFYFNDAHELVIQAEGETVNGVWSTSQGTGDGVIVTISQITGPLQVFIGEWLVVECGQERMVLTANETDIVLERECQ